MWDVCAIYGAGIKHVLLLNSYHRDFTWTSQQTSSVLDVFAKRDDIELHIEDMDTKRRSPESMEPILLEYYKGKFRQSQVVAGACEVEDFFSPPGG